MFAWLGDNWFVLLQGAGIIGSLLYTGISLRIDTKVRRVNNQFVIAEQHRAIWTQFYRWPELARILNAASDVTHSPITDDEDLFVTLVILHLNSVYYAMKDGMFLKPEGLRKDVASFFSLPIPRAIWERMKSLQDREFVKFVDACLSDQTRDAASPSHATKPKFIF